MARDRLLKDIVHAIQLLNCPLFLTRARFKSRVEWTLDKAFVAALGHAILHVERDFVLLFPANAQPLLEPHEISKGHLALRKRNG